jgi:AcrR family transcriptional regulator
MNRDRRRADTEARLLDASIAMLREKGYAQFRPAEVGARAGFSDGLVFRYFETKLDLVAAALSKELDEIVASVEAVPVLFPGAPPKRRDLLEAAAALILDPNRRWVFEMAPAIAFDEQLQERLAPTIADYNFRLERAAAQAAIGTVQLPASNAVVFMRLLIYSLQGAALADMATGASGREQSIIALLLSIGEAVLGPESP